jgi:(p)ppGpp synthase/HD superfamily hydrolase
LEAHWKSDHSSNTYTIHTQLQFAKEKMSIVDIIAIFASFSIPIFKFELAKLDENSMLATIEGDVSNPAKLSFLFQSLNKHHSALEVVSKFIS